MKPTKWCGRRESRRSGTFLVPIGIDSSERFLIFLAHFSHPSFVLGGEGEADVEKVFSKRAYPFRHRCADADRESTDTTLSGESCQLIVEVRARTTRISAGLFDGSRG